MNCGTERGYNAHKSANEPACQYCKSWKAKHDAGLVKVAPIKSKRQTAQCGTASGYAKHRRNSETACKPCRDAMNEYRRTKSQEGRKDNPKRNNQHTANLKPHGTSAAFQRHKRAGEEPCQPCIEAKRIESAEAQRKARAKNPPKPKQVQPCGTNAGNQRHRKNGEPSCEPCTKAMQAYGAKIRAQRRANNPATPRVYQLTPIEHGTEKGRAKHIRRGEPVCEPCRTAYNQANKARYEARKAQQ